MMTQFSLALPPIFYNKKFHYTLILSYFSRYFDFLQQCSLATLVLIFSILVFHIVDPTFHW